MNAWKRTGEKPVRLHEAAPMPEGYAQVWRDFLALHATRPYAMHGPCRIPQTEIEAYARLRGFRWQHWELSAIQRADDAFMKQHAEGKG